mgnify:CR=1 FL=1
MSQVSWIDVNRLFSFVIWLHVSHVNNTNNQFPNLRTQKLKYLWKEKKLFENGKHHTSWFWNVFQISSIYFLLHGHLKGKSYENTQLRLLLSILLEEHLTSNFIVCISRYKSLISKLRQSVRDFYWKLHAFSMVHFWTLLIFVSTSSPSLNFVWQSISLIKANSIWRNFNACSTKLIPTFKKQNTGIWHVKQHQNQSSDYNSVVNVPFPSSMEKCFLQHKTKPIKVRSPREFYKIPLTNITQQTTVSRSLRKRIAD